MEKVFTELHDAYTGSAEGQKSCMVCLASIKNAGQRSCTVTLNY